MAFIEIEQTETKSESLLVGDVVIGADAPLPTSVTTDLKVKTSSVINYNTEFNDQADVASRTLSQYPSVAGKQPATGDLMVNMQSTNGADLPNLHAALRLCKLEGGNTETLKIEVDDASVFMETNIIENITEAGSAKASVIDGNFIFLTGVTTAFSVGDELTLDGGAALTTVTAVSAFLPASYVFNSQNKDVGSYFLWNDGNVKGLKNAVANLSISLVNGALGETTINFVGSADMDATTTAPMPVVDRNACELPPSYMNAEFAFSFGDVCQNQTGTDRYTPFIVGAQFNAGNTLENLENANADRGIEKGVVTNRSDAGGTFTIYQDDLTNFNIHEQELNNTIFRMQWRIGDGTEGKTIYFREYFTINGKTEGVQNGQKTWEVTYKRIGLNGDDELEIIFA